MNKNNNVETNNEKNILSFPEEAEDFCLKESIQIPSGFMEEVYFNKETKEISFSSPMSKNSWTRSEDKVGEIESFNFSDLEGWKTIDEEFVEVDDQLNETDPNFKYTECPRYYEFSSIITTEDAIYRMDTEGWYEGIVNNISAQMEVDQ
jgi:uncharacterized protein YdaT